MFYGSIVVIKRTGVDGSVFPVVSNECLFGRDDGCDIRVQLATVSKSHCKVTINENKQVKEKERNGSQLLFSYSDDVDVQCVLKDSSLKE
jgi:antigen KI-67